MVHFRVNYIGYSECLDRESSFGAFYPTTVEPTASVRFYINRVAQRPELGEPRQRGSEYIVVPRGVWLAERGRARTLHYLAACCWCLLLVLVLRLAETENKKNGLKLRRKPGDHTCRSDPTGCGIGSGQCPDLYERLSVQWQQRGLSQSSLTLSGSMLYGTTSQGGTSSKGTGTVFRPVKINGGTFTLLSFSGTGGAYPGDYPYGDLTLSGTVLYGMTSDGGSNIGGTVFSVGTNGSGFQNLLSFTGTGGPTGREPFGGLTLSGTTLYGMTSDAAQRFGNVFSVGTNGSGFQNLLSLTYEWN